MSRNLQARASFAQAKATSLPGEAIRAAANPSRAFNNTQKEKPHASHGSEMVKRDKPQPVLRPTPALGAETDRAVFDAAWSREQRKAEFIKARKSAPRDQFRTRNH